MADYGRLIAGGKTAPAGRTLGGDLARRTKPKISLKKPGKVGKSLEEITFGKAAALAVAGQQKQPKRHPYANSIVNTSSVATGVASMRKPGITATGHLAQATNLPKVLGGKGKGHYANPAAGQSLGARTSASVKGIGSRLGSPEMGTSATGAGIHAFRSAAPGTKALPRVGQAAGAFARGIPKSPGAALAAGGAAAGLGIGAAISHHRKQKALKAAVPGYASKSLGPLEIWDRPVEFESQRTVDGIPESQHAAFLERLEPVRKDYYYESAPQPRPRKERHAAEAVGGAAFVGAAAGAAAGPQLRRAARKVAPKAKALKIALKAK